MSEIEKESERASERSKVPLLRTRSRSRTLTPTVCVGGGGGERGGDD